MKTVEDLFEFPCLKKPSHYKTAQRSVVHGKPNASFPRLKKPSHYKTLL